MTMRLPRITEFKHLTRQEHLKTTIVKEFPAQYDPSRPELEPYYPFPWKKTSFFISNTANMQRPVPTLFCPAGWRITVIINMSDTIKNALRVFDEQLR